MILKKFLAMTLMICIMASVFGLTTLAADFPASDVTFQLSADKSEGSAVLAFLNKDCIMLAIAIIGLVATIVSAVLIAVDRKKEVKANREKESNNNTKTVF